MLLFEHYLGPPIYTAVRARKFENKACEARPTGTGRFWKPRSPDCKRRDDGFQNERNAVIGLYRRTLFRFKIQHYPLGNPFCHGLSVFGVQNSLLVFFVPDIAKFYIDHGR